MYKESRKIWKHALWLTRAKLIYTRITLTKFTTSYFFVALITSLILVVLQSVTYADNSHAADAVDDILDMGNITHGLVFVMDGRLMLCQDIPSEAASHCTTVPGTGEFLDTRSLIPRMTMEPEMSNSGTVQGVLINGEISLDQTCLDSLLWLRDLLRDARREDVVTGTFHIWLFSLSFVTIMNESLPHLSAALFGHVLGTAWTAFRVANANTLERQYENFIVRGPCQVDLLGTWWDIRMRHNIPITVIHGVALILMCYLSVNLFKVYAKQSLSRVGASPAIHEVYKLVLLLSVSLQLAGFFTLAATGMWIDKVSGGTIRLVAKHLPQYIAAFSIMAVLLLPWLVLGWRSVRHEKRYQFLAFLGISVALMAFTSVMFASPIYRHIFACWPFFATMTVTSFILLVATSAAGIVCRLHFGKGLAHYLHVTEALEGEDFTPVVFPTTQSPRSISPDVERKDSFVDEKGVDAADMGINPLHYVQPPKRVVLPTYSSTRQNKVTSVYSDTTRATIKLSSTPPLAAARPTLDRVDENLVRKASSSSTSSKSSVSTTQSSSLRGQQAPTPPGVHGRPLMSSPVKISPFSSPSSGSLEGGSPAVSLNRDRVGLPSNPKPAGSKPAGNYI